MTTNSLKTGVLPTFEASGTSVIKIVLVQAIKYVQDLRCSLTNSEIGHQMEISGQSHSPPSAPGEGASDIHLIGDGWNPDPAWATWRRRKSLTSAGN